MADSGDSSVDSGEEPRPPAMRCGQRPTIRTRKGAEHLQVAGVMRR
jgi:hypothetical protein